MNQKEEAAAITPEESLDSLPQLNFDPQQAEADSDLRQAELLQSVLSITRIDHVAETQMVKDAVRNALGRVPEAGE